MYVFMSEEISKNFYNIALWTGSPKDCIGFACKIQKNYSNKVYLMALIFTSTFSTMNAFKFHAFRFFWNMFFNVVNTIGC
jgi:hypothetical protein